jgi:putative ABC transport system permease protein
MEILKEISRDRLIIMVTHNAELAETYATRIVRVKDGEVLSDSDPFDAAADEERPAKADLRKPSLRFGTALGLSFNNLMTKKGRTFLTAFAGSIGIIGIALILSLSNGIQTYLDRVAGGHAFAYRSRWRRELHGHGLHRHESDGSSTRRRRKARPRTERDDGLLQRVSSTSC